MKKRRDPEATTAPAEAGVEARPAGLPASARVLMLSHHERHFPGGAAIADRALAGELSAAGCDVDLLFYDDLLPAWVRGTWRQLLFPWAAALAFRRRHAGRPYDVVDATAGDAWVLALLLPRRRGRPLLAVRTHGLEHRRAELDRERRRAAGRIPAWPTRLYHYRYRLGEVARDLRRADLVFFLNEEDRSYALAVLGLAAEKVHVLPNGLPPYLLEGAARRDAGTLHDGLFLGRWIPEKGADLLPRIVRRAFGEDPRLRLTLAGVDAEPERVLAGFDPRDRPRLRVIPRYDHRDLPAILAGHGVLLAPSRAEGCSLALLEGMAGGLAPLATGTGYALDLLRHGENGFLFDPDDAEGFARTWLALARDPDASRIGERARQAAGTHSWSALARRRLEIWSRAAPFVR